MFLEQWQLKSYSSCQMSDWTPRPKLIFTVFRGQRESRQAPLLQCRNEQAANGFTPGTFLDVHMKGWCRRKVIFVKGEKVMVRAVVCQSVVGKSLHVFKSWARGQDPRVSRGAYVIHTDKSDQPSVRSTLYSCKTYYELIIVRVTT